MQSKLLWNEGRHLQSAQVLLDIDQCSNDLTQGSTYIAGIDALRDHEAVIQYLLKKLKSRKLSRESCGVLEQELCALDRAFLWESFFLRARLIDVGSSFLKEDVAVLGFAGEQDLQLKDARHLFSSRLMLSEAFEALDTWYARLAEQASTPWAQAKAVMDEVNQQAASSRNAIIRKMSEGDLELPHSRGMIAWRNYRSQIRILRVALHYQATDQVLDIDDPFGTKLRHSRQGSTLRVWSVGRDGVDDGGSGEWEPDKGKDIVLEIDR